jgi:hypothetical protein
MNKNDQMRELLIGALALLDKPKGPEKSAKVSIGEIVPDGVKLYASQAKARRGETEGAWHWYLVMPYGWNPPVDGPRWIQNPSTSEYWDTGRAVARGTEGPNTKAAAIAQGTIRLMGVLG